MYKPRYHGLGVSGQFLCGPYIEGKGVLNICQ